MHTKFVETSNVKRFMAATAAIEQRAAREACIVLGQGNAGYGKSQTGQYWATQQDAVFIRLKANCTPKWFLDDLVIELGEQAPERSCEKLFNQAVGFLVKDPKPIVVDEVENGLSQIKVLETIRDIGDLVDVTVIFLGREYVWGRLKRYPQFATRVGARADFSAETREDVAKCVAELAEVEVAEEVVEKIYLQSEGHIREVIKAIKNVERIGMRADGKVTAEMTKGQPLTHEWQRAGSTKR